MNRLLFVIGSRGKANTVLRRAQACGLPGGTILPAEGTLQGRLLYKLGLTDAHKEVLIFSVNDILCDGLYSETRNILKKNKGMAFSVPFRRWQVQPADRSPVPGEADPAYYCIMTVTDRGRSRACLRAARAGGAVGATVIRGHGAGIPTDFYFPLAIEPQKDIVLIVAKKERAPQIRQRIFSDLELEKIGKGIIFTLPVSWLAGSYEDSLEGKRGDDS